MFSGCLATVIFCLCSLIKEISLQGLVCKTNRKLVAGAALLVAAKITDFGSSMRTADVVNVCFRLLHIILEKNYI